MAEEHVQEESSKPKSRLPRLLLSLVLLLVVAVVVNWKNITDIVSGKRTFKSVLYGKSPRLAGGPTFRFPDPMGPEDAKVKAVVIAQEGNECHRPLVALWMGIGKLEPKRIRVEFRDAMIPPPETSEETDHLPELGCDSGVLINGKNKFEIGQGKKKKTLYLTGPHPVPSDIPLDEDLPRPDEGHGWNLSDVAQIVNKALKEVY